MTILEALKSEANIRVLSGDKWLIADDNNEFTVYCRPYGAKKTVTLITTDKEEDAVSVLLNGVDSK